jgi:hypothetical protein
MVSTRITVKNTEKKIEVKFERKGTGLLDESQILRWKPCHAQQIRVSEAQSGKRLGGGWYEP